MAQTLVAIILRFRPIMGFFFRPVLRPFTVSVTADSSFVVGTTYCAYFVDSLSPISLGSNIVTFTIQPATPIPEYPYGLAVLAIFMMLAYGVIRRKTRFDYT